MTRDKVAIDRRRRAEEEWERRSSAANAASASEADAARLVHELQVHQIELEMQFDELRSARQETEAERARYAALYDFAPSGYVTMNRLGSMSAVNLAAARLLGRDRVALLERRLGVFIDEKDRGTFARFLDRVFTVEGMQRCEVGMLDASDVRRDVQVEGTLRAERQECWATLEDVTLRRQDEKSLRLIEVALHESQRMEAVGRLAGGIAHDFNNLLTVINGNYALLREALPEDIPEQEMLSEAINAGERAAALTQQLLTFSRRQSPQAAVMDANAAVLGVTQMLRVLLGPSITLLMECHSEPLRVLLGAGQLEQVLLNLAANARDAMPKGGVLTVRTTRVLPEADVFIEGTGRPRQPFVEVSVADTGQGMPAEVQARIFEPFFTTKDVGRGTGLGLALAYSIVHDADGHITVESTVGGGTTFQVCLPEAQAGAEVATTTDALAAADLPRGAETVLLVEPDAAVRRLTRRMLVQRGYTVVEARDGQQALAVADAHDGEIALLLTDVVMPIMHGVALASALRLKRPLIKVLYASGSTEEMLGAYGIDHAASGFLAKPFTARDLATQAWAVLHDEPADPA